MATFRFFLAPCLIALGCALLICANEPHSSTAAWVGQPNHFQSSASAWNISRTSSACTLQRAHSSSFIGFLSDVSQRQQAGAFGLALEGSSAPVGAHQKGEQVLGVHAFTFAFTRPVTQPVTRLIFQGASLGSRAIAARVPAARTHGGAGRRAA